ncbi:PREDICTED: uncharacterized protein LOC108501805 [Lepidothrix coronata]|uniref:Uncharacterized protein LOC108501805 n=1 Tax=Lepidothrix coronata TaxID=321398 RepID=A0A6J0HZ18_9PASS|nr:PREDICTED: uncharacterized protein LOC108501805 [Lepidothrix coronata]
MLARTFSLSGRVRSSETRAAEHLKNAGGALLPAAYHGSAVCIKRLRRCYLLTSSAPPPDPAKPASVFCRRNPRTAQLTEGTPEPIPAATGEPHAEPPAPAARRRCSPQPPRARARQSLAASACRNRPSHTPCAHSHHSLRPRRRALPPPPRNGASATHADPVDREPGEASKQTNTFQQRMSTAPRLRDAGFQIVSERIQPSQPWTYLGWRISHSKKFPHSHCSSRITGNWFICLGAQKWKSLGLIPVKRQHTEEEASGVRQTDCASHGCSVGQEGRDQGYKTIHISGNVIPHPPDSSLWKPKSLLQPDPNCLALACLWVKCRHSAVSTSAPLYPGGTG